MVCYWEIKVELNPRLFPMRRLVSITISASSGTLSMVTLTEGPEILIDAIT